MYVCLHACLENLIAEITLCAYNPTIVGYSTLIHEYFAICISFMEVSATIQEFLNKLG